MRRREILAAALASAAASAAQAQTAPALQIKRWAWAGVSLRVGAVEVFIDARAPNADDGAPGPELSSDAARRFALATHHHGDHLDLPALRALLGERGYLVVQSDVARQFDTRVVNVQPVELYEPVYLSRGGREFVAFAAPASDGLGSPQTTWVVEGAGKRIIHCGDTIWHGAWENIGRAYGPFDAAFVPINGARIPTAGAPEEPHVMTLTPEEAAEAAMRVRANLAIPIHYGAPRTDAYIETDDPERRFLAAARRLRVRTRVLNPGETMTL
jgi:L-ascorbate metabolism protein UlaG (beta-lactamase superfamily)